MLREGGCVGRWWREQWERVFGGSSLNLRPWAQLPLLPAMDGGTGELRGVQ